MAGIFMFWFCCVFFFFFSLSSGTQTDSRKGSQTFWVTCGFIQGLAGALGEGQEP